MRKLQLRPSDFTRPAFGRKQFPKLFALLLLCLAGLFASQQDLKGTLSTALLPDAEAATAADPLVSMTAPASDTAQAAEAFIARVGIAHGAISPNGMIDAQKLQPLLPSLIDTETLWLVRCIYSETKRPQEQELIAWVVRNRVESGYRGKRTYQGVVLDPMQFSAFNPGTRTRAFYSGLTAASKVAGWQKALSIAHVVRNAPEQLRPFPLETRHFYSEQSMVGRRAPVWALDKLPVEPRRDFALEARRFRFYDGIS